MAFTPVPTYTGTVPNRDQQPADFANNADDWLAYQLLFTDGVNLSGSEINALGVQATVDANASAASAVDSAASAVDSLNSSEIARSMSNFKGNWSALTGALNKPASVYHKGAYWHLLNNLANVAASEPGVSADWLFNNGTSWSDKITASATLNANQYAHVEATGAAIDLTQPAFSVNDFLVIHNNTESTEIVRLLNPSNTIRGKKGVAIAGDNIIIEAGDTINLLAISATILEIV